MSSNRSTSHCSATAATNSGMLSVLPGIAKYCGEFSRIDRHVEPLPQSTEVLADPFDGFLAELRADGVRQFDGAAGAVIDGVAAVERVGRDEREMLPDPRRPRAGHMAGDLIKCLLTGRREPRNGHAQAVQDDRDVGLDVGGRRVEAELLVRHLDVVDMGSRPFHERPHDRPLARPTTTGSPGSSVRCCMDAETRGVRRHGSWTVGISRRCRPRRSVLLE